MLNFYKLTAADFDLNKEGEALTAEQLAECVPVHTMDLDAAIEGCHIGLRHLEIAGVDTDAVIVGEVFECQDHYCEAEGKMEYYSLHAYLVRPWGKARKHERVECLDGFGVSVQAFDGLYCSPRADKAERYAAVELGYPTFEGEKIEQNRTLDPDELETPTTEDGTEIPPHVVETLQMLAGFGENFGTVYAFVPVELVNLIIARHGGAISGAAPAGVDAEHIDEAETIKPNLLKARAARKEKIAAAKKANEKFLDEAAAAEMDTEMAANI